MHFLYIDESGSTGADLGAEQQPVFVMASLIVSDEKWHKTKEAVRTILESYFGNVLAVDFELHACELLSPNGEGPFAGHDREKRSMLAIDLLNIATQRGHYLFHVPVYKSALASYLVPDKDWGFEWRHPWQFAFSLQVTMFEDFLRSPSTGRTSTGLAIIDHEANCVEFVRRHTAARQADKGWKQLKKVVEIGYSASSHANPLIQFTDLAAFVLKKYYELETDAARAWPPEAKRFYKSCRDAIWPRIMYKNLAFKKLNVDISVINHAKVIRKPRT